METMRLRRPIVVGVEDKQQAALRYALNEAQSLGCGVRVVHAYSITTTGSAMLSDDVMDASAEAAFAVVDAAREFIESEDTSVPVEYAVEFGAPTHVLQGESQNARAVILGPENSSWYERILAGEVGSWLSRHAQCPVVVVPEYWYQHQVRRGGIVVTVDGATDAHGPLTFAFAAADRLSQELHVLHVVPPATSVGDEEEHRMNIAQVLAGWADKYPTVRVFRSLVFGEADEVCIGSTSLANLVVVGRPHGQNLPFALVRPVAVSVIKEANCPVAVVPPNYDG